MNEEINILDMIIHSTAFKATVTAIFSTLTVWLLVRIKNIPTKKELKKVKDESFAYTDKKIQVHEEKQVLELNSLLSKVDNIEKKGNETYNMVFELYKFHLKK